MLVARIAQYHIGNTKYESGSSLATVRNISSRSLRNRSNLNEVLDIQCSFWCEDYFSVVQSCIRGKLFSVGNGQFCFLHSSQAKRCAYCFFASFFSAPLLLGYFILLSTLYIHYIHYEGIVKGRKASPSASIIFLPIYGLFVPYLQEKRLR